MAPTDPLAPIVTAAAATSSVLLAGIGLWLLLAVLLTITARTAALGTRAGRVADALLRRLAPAAVRRAMAVAVGLALSLGTAPAGAETSPTADPSVTAAAATAVDGAAPVPDLDWPATTPPAAGTSQGSGRTAPAVPRGVVVRPGDSLWRITERALRADVTSRDVAAGHVAAQWPLWWQANREVIGDDPDLILPGAHLVAPPH